jgi:Tol biopolymer transport system component
VVIRSRTRGIVGAVVAVLVLTLLSSTADATFPGANGRIAYGTDSSGVHTVLPSGHGATAISSTGFDAVWSPNGKRLAFTDYADNGLGGWGPDVYTMRANGTDVRRLTEWGSYQMGAAWAPSYSPGGGRIVFLIQAYHYTTDMAIMRSDGSDAPDGSEWQYPLPYADKGTEPVWSPSGEIAYLEGGERGSIWGMRPDGSGNHRLVYLGLGGGSGPVYSPDGSEFLFRRVWADRSVHTRLADADGTNVREPPCRATLDRMGPLYSYSPDGHWILAGSVNQDTGNATLVRISLGSCMRTRVAGGAIPAFNGDWQAVPPG